MGWDGIIWDDLAKRDGISWRSGMGLFGMMGMSMGWDDGNGMGLLGSDWGIYLTQAMNDLIDSWANSQS